MRSSLWQQLSESSCVWENALCHFTWALRCHKRGIATALGTHSQKAGNTFLAMMGVIKTTYGKEQPPERTRDICRQLETKPITGVTHQLRMVLNGRWTSCTVWRQRWGGGKGALPVTCSGMGHDSSLRIEEYQKMPAVLLTGVNDIKAWQYNRRIPEDEAKKGGDHR